MEKKKSSTGALLIIMGVLIMAEIATTLLSASVQSVLLILCTIISLAFIALYGFWLYKKPHGNMLKYAMLILAASEIISAAQCIQLYDTLLLSILWAFVAVILVYVSGRLDRIEQNKYLLPIAAIIMFVITFISIFIAAAEGFVLPVLLSWFSDPISIITLMIAYFVRYKEHKEAGLIDAPKK